MNKIDVYSDGSGTTPDKPGGWGWIIVVDDVKHSEGSGYAENGSNNDMELEASIQGLQAASKLFFAAPIRLIGNYNCYEIVLPTVTLISDSQLILGWASGKFKFKQEDKLDKYHELLKLMSSMNAQTKWVRGHSGQIFNERCDYLAGNARKQLSINTDFSSRSDSKIGVKKKDTASIWYQNELYVLDFETLVMEKYNRDVHGKRGSPIEIREDRLR
jgi:ribonuclease HI